MMTKRKIKLFMGVLVFLSIVPSASAQTLAHIRERSKSLAVQTELEAQKVYTRWSHAKELLGKKYQKSVVKAGEDIASLDDVLTEWTSRSIKGGWKKNAREVAMAIIKEAERYSFDPIFLMAVIQSESGFDPNIIGGVGEIGLMQITPQTAKWIAEKYDLPWKGNQSLKNPMVNVRIGAAYMAHLRDKFDSRSQLYLAAYNMGTGNVQKALDRQVWPKEYSSRVLNNYVRFYSQLQEEIEQTID